MKKKLLTGVAMLLAITSMAQGKFQIGNSDFETTWIGINEPGNGWNSFPSATGTFAGFAKGLSAPTTTKLSSGYNNSATAVNLKSMFIKIAKTNANGNLTTGIINMGSSKPTDAKNYNFTKRDNPAHSCLFAGRPDSVVFYAKFFPSAKTVEGQGNFILHGDIDYKDPHETAENEAAYKVAQAQVTIPACSEWTRMSKPFTYATTATSETSRYMLASFTTNPIPGATAGDSLCLDNVVFIYNSALSSLKVGGTAIVDFQKNKYDYTVAQAYQDGCVTFEKDGIGATTIDSYDRATGCYTLQVKGEDISVNADNYKTYKIHFTPSASEETFTDNLIVTINGVSAPAQRKDIKKSAITSNTCTLSLNNFQMYMGTDVMNIGDIILPNVEMTAGTNDTIVYKTTQTIRITSSDPNAMGPMLGDVPVELSAKSKGNKLIASIDINLETMHQIVKVTFGAEDPSSIEKLPIDKKDIPSTIYTMSGIEVKTNGTLKNLPKDIYIINGQKVQVK
ncbi:MAG: calycin-like domain-containing protein [Bacteroidaceae bacterium]